MVPENIIWAAFSAYDYQNKIMAAATANQPEPKDVYYKKPDGSFVKVTAVFDCIDKLRKTYNHSDVKYLGAVLADSKGEIERGRAYPPAPEDQKTAEQRRKELLKERLQKRDPAKYSKLLIKYKDGSLQMPSASKNLDGFWAAMDKYSDDVWDA